MTVLTRTEEGFVQLKKEFDEYEKTNLSKKNTSCLLKAAI